MPNSVTLPNGDTVEFPDDWGPEKMQHALVLRGVLKAPNAPAAPKPLSTPKPVTPTANTWASTLPQGRSATDTQVPDIAPGRTSDQMLGDWEAGRRQAAGMPPDPRARWEADGTDTKRGVTPVMHAAEILANPKATKQEHEWVNQGYRSGWISHSDVMGIVNKNLKKSGLALPLRDWSKASPEQLQAAGGKNWQEHASDVLANPNATPSERKWLSELSKRGMIDRAAITKAAAERVIHPPRSDAPVSMRAATPSEETQGALYQIGQQQYPSPQEQATQTTERLTRGLENVRIPAYPAMAGPGAAPPPTAQVGSLPVGRVARQAAIASTQAATDPYGGASLAALMFGPEVAGNLLAKFGPKVAAAGQTVATVAPLAQMAGQTVEDFYGRIKRGELPEAIGDLVPLIGIGAIMHLIGGGKPTPKIEEQIAKAPEAAQQALSEVAKQVRVKPRARLAKEAQGATVQEERQQKPAAQAIRTGSGGQARARGGRGQGAGNQEVVSQPARARKEVQAEEAPGVADTRTGITSKPKEPQNFTIRREPEPLNKSGYKYSVYREDGSRVGIGEETAEAAEKRLRSFEPVKSVTVEAAPAPAPKPARTPATATIQQPPALITEAAYVDAEGKQHTAPNHPEALVKAHGAVPEQYATQEGRSGPEFGFLDAKGKWLTREQAARRSKLTKQDLKQFEPGEQATSSTLSQQPGGTKPISEGAAAQPGPRTLAKVGDAARIMDTDTFVVDSRRVGGMDYELFSSQKGPEGFIRVADPESGHVSTLLKSPTYEVARKQWLDAVAAAEKSDKPAPAPTHTIGKTPVVLDAAGKPVSVATGETVPTRGAKPVPIATPPAAPEQGAAAKGGVKTGAEAIARTPDNTPVKTKYAVVEAGDLLTSHTDDFTETPGYNQDLQDRGRGRAAAQEQVRRIAANLEPERVAVSATTSEGTPVVGSDLQVESGNGRAMGIRLAYSQHPERASAYKSWIAENAAKYGLKPEDVSGMKQPVLVRVRQVELPVEDRVALARKMGAQSVATMSAPEIAKTDAKIIRGKGILQMFRGGDIDSAENRPFVAAFTGAMPEDSRAGMLTDDGNISSEGIRRVRNALLSGAYDDPNTISRLTESTDDNVRAVGNAMVNTAARMARLREGIAKGEFHDYDISGNVSDAANLMSSLRRRGETVKEHIANGNLFGDTDPLTNDLLLAFEENKRSGKSLTAMMDAYLDAAERQGSPAQEAMFDMGRPTKAEMLRAAIIGVREEGHAGNLFDSAAAGGNEAPAERPPVPAQAVPPKSEAAAPEAPVQRVGRVQVKKDMAGRNVVVEPETLWKVRKGDYVGNIAELANEGMIARDTGKTGPGGRKQYELRDQTTNKPVELVKGKTFDSPWAAHFEYRRLAHRNAVREALQQGLPVSDAVLQDYRSMAHDFGRWDGKPIVESEEAFHKLKVGSEFVDLVQGRVLRKTSSSTAKVVWSKNEAGIGKDVKFSPMSKVGLPKSGTIPIKPTPAPRAPEPAAAPAEAAPERATGLTDQQQAALARTAWEHTSDAARQRIAGTTAEWEQLTPEQRAAASAKPAEAAPERAWMAGGERARVRFEDELHRDMYDLGAKLKQIQSSRGGPKDLRTSQVDTDAITSGLAARTGMDKQAVIAQAMDTYKSVREQMKGVTEGDVRQVRRATGTPEPAPAPEATARQGKPAFGAENKVFTEERKNAALERLKAKSQRLSAGIDPEYVRDLVDIGGYYVEGGIREFGAWAARVRQDVPEADDDHLKAAWGQLRPEVPPEPPVASPQATEAQAGAPRVTGIRHETHQARFEAGQQGEVPRGEGTTPQQQIAKGEVRYTAEGESGAERVMQAREATKENIATADDVGLWRAHHRALGQATLRAEADMRAHLGDKSYVEAHRAAMAAETEWANRMKPFETSWHALGMTMQGEQHIDTGDFAQAPRTSIEQEYQKYNRAKDPETGTEKPAPKMTPEQEKQADVQSNRIAAVQKQLEAVNAKLKDAYAAIERMKADRATRQRVTARTSLPKDRKSLAEHFAKRIADGTLFREAKMGKERGAVSVGKTPKFTVDESIAIWDYLREHYMDRNFTEAIASTGADMGLETTWVEEALTRTGQTRQLTAEAFRLASERRRAVTEARIWARTANDTPARKVLMTVWNIPRAEAILGHGGVVMFTHAGEHVYEPTDWGRWLTNFGRAWRISGEGMLSGVTDIRQRGLKARATSITHERLMETMQAKKPGLMDDGTPDYRTQVGYDYKIQGGLAIDPEHAYDDYQLYGRLFGFVGKAGNLGFDAVKFFRDEDFDHVWAKAPDSVKLNEDGTPNLPYLKELASQINHASGVGNLGLHGPMGSAVKSNLFAGSLTASKWARAVGDPAKASKTFANWKNATPQQKWLAKRTLKRAGYFLGTYTGSLLLNNAMLAGTKQKERVNFTDPTKPDWMRPVWGGKTFEFSGNTLDALHFMLGAVAHASGLISTEERRGVKLGRQEQFWRDMVRYGQGKLAPQTQIGMELGTGEDVTGKPLPGREDVRSRYMQMKRPGYTPMEYAASKGPIPLSELNAEVRQSLREQGVPDPTANQILHAIFSPEGLTTWAIAMTGARVGKPSPESRPAGGGTSPVAREMTKGFRPSAADLRPSRSDLGLSD